MEQIFYLLEKPFLSNNKIILQEKDSLDILTLTDKVSGSLAFLFKRCYTNISCSLREPKFGKSHDWSDDKFNKHSR